jgi:hypothetical protein
MKETAYSDAIVTSHQREWKQIIVSQINVQTERSLLSTLTLSFTLLTSIDVSSNIDLTLSISLFFDASSNCVLSASVAYIK